MSYLNSLLTPVVTDKLFTKNNLVCCSNSLKAQILRLIQTVFSVAVGLINLRPKIRAKGSEIQKWKINFGKGVSPPCFCFFFFFFCCLCTFCLLGKHLRFLYKLPLFLFFFAFCGLLKVISDPFSICRKGCCRREVEVEVETYPGSERDTTTGLKSKWN